MFELVLNIVATSLLTAFIIFMSMRWLFGKIAESIGGFTNLGAKVAGEVSGMRRSTKAVRNKVASDVLEGPNLAGLKMLASQFGFDIDGMIAQHGAEETLAGITQVLAMLGLNPTDLLSKGIGSLIPSLLEKNVSGGLP